MHLGLLESSACCSYISTIYLDPLWESCHTTEHPWNSSGQCSPGFCKEATCFKKEYSPRNEPLREVQFSIIESQMSRVEERCGLGLRWGQRLYSTNPFVLIGNH